MQIKLYRPLNSLVISLETELGPKFFLIDTGCPVSFATKAKEILKGAWFQDSNVDLMPAPFSLRPLSERLGVPIEGFIGLRELIKQWRIYIDFDRGQLLLGNSIRAVDLDDDDRLTLPLTKIMGAPIGISGEIDDQEAKFDSDHLLESPSRDYYIDTGSRFVVIPREVSPQRDQNTPIYRLDLITPKGALPVEVSPAHHFKFNHQGGSELASKLAIATGQTEELPPIIGMEWLSRYNVFISFENRVLSLLKREQGSVESWEQVNEYLYAPQLEVIFDPVEFDKMNRSFSVIRRADYPLPDGLSPFTRYRLKDFVIPAGVEGVNRFISKLFSAENDIITEVDFVDDQGRELMVTMRKLFV